MKTKLYFVITLLTFFALTALPNSFAQGPLAQPSVRLVYFLPSDRPARPDRIEALRQLIKDAQEFYADEMERHGYGRKTFPVETDTDGIPVVHRVNGKFNENYYYTGLSDFKIWEEVYEHFDELEHIYFVAIDVSYETLNDGDSCGLGGIGFLPMGGDANFFVGKIAIRHRSETSGEEGLGGSAIIPASGPCFFDDVHDHNHPLRVTTHELGHAFGLEHDFRDGGLDNKTVMGRGGFRLSNHAAEWLSVSPFFNTKQTNLREPCEIQLLSIGAYSQDLIMLRFKATDADGLHQAQLLVPDIINGTGWGAYRLFGLKRLDGRTSTIEFPVRKTEIVDRVTLQIIDVGGNITWATFLIQLDETSLPQNSLDVNGDGILNISDLIPIISRYGQRGKDSADVNADGIVNIVDVLLVAASVSSLPRQTVETFKAVEVQKWLTDAKQLGIENEYQQKGIGVLEHLLTEIEVPSKSTEVATGPLQTVFEGHTDLVWSVAFSPDGQTLASASWDGTVRLWNLHTQQLETTLIGHTAEVMSVTFSPDGETLASADWNQTILFWNVRTGELIGRIKAHSDGIEAVVFSPDGETLASASADRTIRLWNVRTRRLERTLTGTTRIRSIAFSPNGRTLASGSREGAIQLWDPRTGDLKSTLTEQASWVNAVAFSPDGTMLASGSGGGDNTIRLWDAKTGRHIRSITEHRDTAASVVFSPDSQTLVSGSWDRTLRLWDPRTGQHKKTLTVDAGVPIVVFSPDGTRLASGSNDNKVRLWEFRKDGEATEPSQLKVDVNGDGVVNVQDLVWVASNFGQSGPNDADVNEDGIVNIVDLVLVAGALGDTAAAPTISAASTELFTAQEVQQWLIAAKLSGDNSPVYRRGTLILERLLMVLIPKETALLPNYPNPFNPETWIPYQLTNASTVEITVYDARGKIVRQLDLGHKTAGYHTSRSQAAYWDGRNNFGESVASGVYFYTLTAGDFTATRKMLITK